MSNLMDIKMRDCSMNKTKKRLRSGLQGNILTHIGVIILICKAYIRCSDLTAATGMPYGQLSLGSDMREFSQVQENISVLLEPLNPVLLRIQSGTKIMEVSDTWYGES